MIHVLARRITREIDHYRALPTTTRLLITSYFYRSAAYPLISTFASAYIWQANHNLTLLVLYQIAAMTLLPITFVCNKWLLKHFPFLHLYGAGVMFSGLSALLVVFFRSTAPLSYLVYGSLYGIGNGFYWANRNYLTLRHTTAEIRGTFTGINISLATATSTIIPLIAGWFIVLTVNSRIFPTSQIGYECLVGVAFILLVLAGWIIRNGSFAQPVVAETSRRPFSALWQKARLLSIAIGLVDAPSYILPTVLILKVLGNEGILGSVTGVLSLITAGATYIVGRVQHRYRFLPTFVLFLILFVIAGAPLMASIAVWSVAWYLILTTLLNNLIWTVNEPILMGMQDDEAHNNHITHMRLIIDREIFIDMGRILWFVIFLLLALKDQTLALSVTGTLSGILALIFIFPTVRQH